MDSRERFVGGLPFPPDPFQLRAMDALDAGLARPEGLAAGFGLHAGGYLLSDVQAQAILDLRLHRLTRLEQDKIRSEFKEIVETIKGLIEILSNPERLMQVIREELLAVREQFGDARRTEIQQDQTDLSLEDLITEEDVVVIAWAEDGEPDLDFDGLEARPPRSGRLAAVEPLLS